MNKKHIKIVTIGGGSSYTPELIDGFISRANELPIDELWLVDIEAGKEKLEIVGALAKRMLERVGLNWKLVLSLNVEEALVDADFVTTQFRVGQLDARVLDERLPLEKGILGQETNGAGGIMKAFRTIPVILDIIEKMKRLCPDAWLINFTNPAGIITETAMRVGGWEKTIGLCNVPFSLINQSNNEMKDEVDQLPLTFQFGGLNHFLYHRVWNASGQEITLNLIERFYGETKRSYQGVKNITDVPLMLEQVRATKLLPSYYHRYYYRTEEMLIAELKEFTRNTTRAEVVKQTEAILFDQYRQPELTTKPEALSLRGGAHYSDAACECISAIYNNKHSVMVVNTRNNGAIRDLPIESVVEISSVMTKRGPIPLQWGEFPAPVRGPIQLMKAMEECVIMAGTQGDYDMALQAFFMHPLIPSGQTAKDLLDQMLLVNERYLPQFASTIARLKNKSKD